MSRKIVTVFGLVWVLVAGVLKAEDVTIFCELGGSVSAWDQTIPVGDHFYVRLTSTTPLNEVYGYMIELNYDQSLLTAVDINTGIDRASQWINAGSPVDVSFGGDDYATYLDGEPVLINVPGQAIVSLAVSLPFDTQPSYPWHHVIAQVAFVATQQITGITPINFALNQIRGGVIGTGIEPASVEFIKSCGLTADLNHDGHVNWADFSVFASQWLASGRGLTADLDYNEQVNWSDFSVFANQWLASCL